MSGAATACVRRSTAMDEAPANAASMADLYAELRLSLLAFLRKHTGDPQAAEDLLHDVVVKALAAGARPSSIWLVTQPSYDEHSEWRSRAVSCMARPPKSCWTSPLSVSPA